MQHTVTTYTCDLGHRGGKSVDATTSHEIVVDGKPFRVDVCDEHDARFEREVGAFCINPLPRNQTPRPRRIPLHTRDAVAAARAWAIEQGKEVSTRGRVPNAIIEEYLATAS